MFWAEISQGAFELKNIDPLNLNANSTESSFRRTSSSLLNQRCQKRKKKYYVALHSLSIITACLSASEASSHASGMAPGMAATAMNRHSW